MNLFRPSSTRPYLGAVLVLTSALSFALMGPFAKLAFSSSEVGPVGLLAARFVVAGFIWAFVVFIFRPRKERVAARSLRRPLAMAGFFAAVGGISEFIAYGRLSVSLVVVILYTSPLWVLAAEWLVGGRTPSRRDWFAILLVLAGLVLLLRIGWAPVDVIGVLLALVGAFGWAGLIMIVETGLHRQSLMPVASWVSWAAAIAAALIAAATGNLVPLISEPRALLTGLLLGAVPTFAGLTLMFAGQRLIGAFRTSLLTASEPIFAAALAWMLIGERMGLLQGVGAGLIVGGILLVGQFEARPAP